MVEDIVEAAEDNTLERKSQDYTGFKRFLFGSLEALDINVSDYIGQLFSCKWRIQWLLVFVELDTLIKCFVRHHFLKDSMSRRPWGEVCAEARPDRARGGLHVWSLQHHRRWHHRRLVFHLQQLPPRRLSTHHSIQAPTCLWEINIICIKLFD